MFILPSISSGLKFWSVKQILIYENCQIKVFESIKFLDEMSNNRPNDLYVTINEYHDYNNYITIMTST